MKKTLTPVLLILLTVPLAPLFAQVPNGGFENWTNGDPDGWLTNNIATFAYPVAQGTPPYSGTYAVRGETVASAAGDIAPTLATIDGMGNGFAVTQAYGALSFYYKLNTTGTDVMSVTIFMLDGMGALVGAGGNEYTGQVSAYTQTVIPINYIGPNPVQCIITVSLTDTVNPTPPVGDFLVIDEMTFTAATGIPVAGQAGKSLQLFPNPAGSTAWLSGQFVPGQRIHTTVYSSDGRCVRQDDLTAISPTAIAFPVSSLAPGVYCVTVSAGEQRWAARLVKE
jgi:hypothetical protein